MVGLLTRRRLGGERDEAWRGWGGDREGKVGFRRFSKKAQMDFSKKKRKRLAYMNYFL